MTTTAQEYAKQNKISVSAARARLEKLVQAGQATRKVSYEDCTRSRTSRDMPAHKVVRYTMIEAAPAVEETAPVIEETSVADTAISITIRSKTAISADRKARMMRWLEKRVSLPMMVAFQCYDVTRPYVEITGLPRRAKRLAADFQADYIGWLAL